ncbi:malectin domain-containing carbohydrate-binding protein [Streptomyces sp. DT224]|uniref:malectin domain-containing carbohydrate-binding protein n=1 Tax=Streptomyces sp. DT224 TaxID=3393426 RepID=UPI003CEEB35C
MSLPLAGVLPASAAVPPEPSLYAQKTAGAVREQLDAKDRVTFWVQLGEQADTSAARKKTRKADRGRAVIAARKAQAGRSQADVVSLLKEAGARYTSYWIANTLKVTGDRDLARKIAERPEVASIDEDKALALPHATTGGRVNTVDGVEWNVDRINAPKVWNSLGKVGASHYETATRSAVLGGGDVSRADSALRTGLVTASPADGWQLVVPAGERRTRTFTLANSGLGADYTLAEKDGAGWLTAAPATGKLATGGTQKVTVTFDASSATPGTVLRGTLRVASESGRTPAVDLPVVVAVPAYRTAIDAGSATAVTDSAGELWAPDRAYTEGSHGYLGRSRTVTTRKTIAGTDEQKLFSSATEGAYEYRFDGLPEGVYEVELGFAELSSTQPGKRLFDVLAEGTQELPDVDIALEAGGTYHALNKRFTVRVGDGQLNLRFASPADQPLVNTVRVTHRPDLG